MTKKELENIIKIKFNISKVLKEQEEKQVERYSNWLISHIV